MLGNAGGPSGDPHLPTTDEGTDEHLGAVEPKHQDDTTQLNGEDTPTQLYDRDVAGQLELLGQAALLARRVRARRCTLHRAVCACCRVASPWIQAS